MNNELRLTGLGRELCLVLNTFLDGGSTVDAFLYLARRLVCYSAVEDRDYKNRLRVIRGETGISLMIGSAQFDLADETEAHQVEQWIARVTAERQPLNPETVISGRVDEGAKEALEIPDFLRLCFDCDEIRAKCTCETPAFCRPQAE